MSSPPTQNLPPTPPKRTIPNPTQPPKPTAPPGLAIFRQQLRHEIHRGTGGPGEADDHEDHLPVAGWEVEMWINGWDFHGPLPGPTLPQKETGEGNKRKKGTKLLGFLFWFGMSQKGVCLMIFRNYVSFCMCFFTGFRMLADENEGEL